MNYAGRIDNVRNALGKHGIDALLVTNLTNVRYLTGFSGTNGQVLISTRDEQFLSDPRYASRASQLVHDAEVVVYPYKLLDLLGGLLAERGIQRLGIEAATMTIAERDQLDEALEGIDLVATKAVVEDLRRAKDPEQLTRIREAVALADAAYDAILDRLSPGTTERDVAFQLEVLMRTNGADGVSFEPIVGSGPLSAHIHHTPGERQLEKGDLVLLDFGCRVDGYCSDLTRTVVLGPASEEQRERYELVLEAQARGLAAVRAGERAADVDAAARGTIDAVGLGDAFGHGLGHGVGLDIHEAPTLNRISDDTLVEGDVVTVEPGVYVVDSGGIRIEDCVVVTKDGGDVLGSAPKDQLVEL